MKITSITLSDSRQLPDGSWKKIEWVAELEEGDTPETCTAQTAARIDNVFSQLYQQPNSYAPFGSQQQNDDFLKSMGFKEQEEKIPKSKEELIQGYVDQINEVQSVEKLKLEWAVLANSIPKIKEAYTKKLTQLTENPTTNG